jgi:N6-adenosine-specific RNA methylase IME4
MSGLVIAPKPGALTVEKARVMLAHATRTDEVKKIRDVAVAMKAYARTQQAGKEIALDAGEIIIRAEARLGELAKNLPRAPNDGSRGNQAGPARGPAKRDALASVGVSKQRAAEFETVASLPSKDLDAYVSAERKAGRAPSTSGAVALAKLPQRERKKAISKLDEDTTIRQVLTDVRRDVRVDRLAEISKGNTKLKVAQRFPVVLADPPWRYEHVKTESRAIENQYPTLALRAICDLPVAKLCTPDCVLFLWSPSPKLAEALEVITAWGFTYRTNMIWMKDKIGMGYYARQQHELLLIATRGDPPTPPPAARPPSVIKAKRGRHSEKPEQFYAIIEKMYPKFARMELFSRTARKGWTAWGNEAPNGQ